MNHTMESNRVDNWRAYPLDGALLYFQPGSGLNIRWDGPETRSLQRRSPRIVMFGITNRCNLSCNFCSRDQHAGSNWTTANAFEMLSGLADRGVLEVAFGGGEPLAFRGFDDMIVRLGRETPLALHFTTNGTLLTPERLFKMRDYLGEIRLSIYDDNAWSQRVELLAACGIRFGVNLLVTPMRLKELSALLQWLAMLGCQDIALLSYVGRDAGLHLGDDERQQLSEIINQSPIRTRLSVCFGDRLDPLPKLFEGDCGAGLDFIVLTSDGKVKACSFQDSGIDVANPDDVIKVWQQQREWLLQPANLPGCTRTNRLTAPLSDGIRIWQSFSGNNSGDCVLVGRFEKQSAAQKFLADLKPHFQPGEPYSEQWRHLLNSAGITPEEYELAPTNMIVTGKTVMLETYSADDDFPALRALLWRRGGRAVYSAIHEHDKVILLAGIRCPDAAALDAVEAELAINEIGEFHRRESELFGVVNTAGSISDQLDSVTQITNRYNAAIAAELIPIEEPIDLPAVLAMRPLVSEQEWLWVRFHNPENAAAFAGRLSGKYTHIDRYVIIEAEKIRARLGYFAQYSGGVAEVIGCNVMRFVPNLWKRDPLLDETEINAQLQQSLQPYLTDQGQVQLRHDWHGLSGQIDTINPGAALIVLVEFAQRHEFSLWLNAHPDNRLLAAITRISRDLKN